MPITITDFRSPVHHHQFYSSVRTDFAPDFRLEPSVLAFAILIYLYLEQKVTVTIKPEHALLSWDKPTK